MELFIFLVILFAVIWVLAQIYYMTGANARYNKDREIYKSRIAEEIRTAKYICDLCYDDINQHIHTLAHQYSRGIKTDRYGTVDRTDWDKELQFFTNTVLYKRALTRDEHIHRRYMKIAYFIRKNIEEMVVRYVLDLPSNEAVEQLKSLEFETWCAQVLRKEGWLVELTKATGDQGADLIARKLSKIVVIQCKLYSGAVGNKAVQEAFSAQIHYGAKLSCVVTNAEFTRAAKDLAESTGVLLINHRMLSSLDHFVAGSENNRTRLE